MGLSFSLITNSWLHIGDSRIHLDFSDKTMAVEISQYQLSCLFAWMLCDPGDFAFLREVMPSLISATFIKVTLFLQNQQHIR